MKLKEIFFASRILVISSNLKGQNKTADYQEPYRLQVHFSPQEKWMNDPNGMVYNKGIYHLFYQFYPNGTTWGQCIGGTLKVKI